MIVTPFNLAFHYSTLCQWWEERKFQPIERDLLPSTGFAVGDEEEFLAMGFLYVLDAPIGWFAWITSNPGSDKIKRQKALDVLIENLCAAGKAKGLRVIFAETNHPRLKDRYLSCGFTEGDQGSSQFFRGV